MRLKAVVSAFAVVAAVGLLALPADAAPKKRAVSAGGHTVFYSRDENGHARTRIIIQKRSYLDPGTESFPGEYAGHNYAWSPNHRASSVLDNTVFGANETALPGPFTLPFKDTPWLEY